MLRSISLSPSGGEGLAVLKPAIAYPDTARALVPYGDAFQPGEIVEIPEADLPAGTPAWMRGVANWAMRSGTTAALRRVTITVKIPTAFRP